MTGEAPAAPRTARPSRAPAGQAPGVRAASFLSHPVTLHEAPRKPRNAPEAPTPALPQASERSPAGVGRKGPRGAGTAGPLRRSPQHRPARNDAIAGKHDRKHRRAHPAAAANGRAAHLGCNKAASHWTHRSLGNSRSRRRGADRETLPAPPILRLLIGQDGAGAGPILPP